MATTQIFADSELDRLAVIGQAIYEEKLRSLLEPRFNGRVVAIHLDSGDYAVGPNSPEALRALYKMHPDDGLTMTRIVGPDRDDPTLSRMLVSEGTRRGTRK
jgi:hypothetical protein